jgi:E3 ubiquitin-protein ligase DOA10
MGITRATICRLCRVHYPAQQLIAPCKCNGVLRYVHCDCLHNFRLNAYELGNTDNFLTCTVCHYGYESDVDAEIQESIRQEPYMELMKYIATVGLCFIIFLLLGISFSCILWYFLEIPFVYCIMIYFLSIFIAFGTYDVIGSLIVVGKNIRDDYKKAKIRSLNRLYYWGVSNVSTTKEYSYKPN